MKTYPVWKVGAFRYLDCDPFKEIDRATIDWVMEKCSHEFDDPKRLISFVYGTASVMETDWGTRLKIETNSGGATCFNADVMYSFIGNFKEQTQKQGHSWYRHLPLRKRLMLRLLMLLF